MVFSLCANYSFGVLLTVEIGADVFVNNRLVTLVSDNSLLLCILESGRNSSEKWPLLSNLADLSCGQNKTIIDTHSLLVLDTVCLCWHSAWLISFIK